MKYYPSLIAAPLLITLASCGGDSNYDFEGSKEELDQEIAASNPPQALFNPNPAAPVLPFPNSLFFQGSLDGTLNLPVAETDDQTLANPRVALNQSDGFSTVAPISTTISEPLDPATLTIGENIRIFEVTTTQGIAVTGILGEISNPQLMAAASVDNQLVLLPTVPLKPKTDYLVVLTNGITDLDVGSGEENPANKPLTASLVYNLLKGDVALTDPGLEGLRGATGSHLAAAQGAGIDPASVVLSWVFKTQSIREVLQAVKDQSAASPLMLANSGQNTGSEGIDLRGIADIYIGTLDIPYYLTPKGDDDDGETSALAGYWENANGAVVGAIGESGAPDYAPVAKSTEVIPVLLSVPNANSLRGGNRPATGWPVTIFQHGITRSRTDMLAIADTMADAGRAVIAIDMPLHGLVNPANPFNASNTPFEERERTFEIDLVVNPVEDGEVAEEGAPTEGADGQIDSSGEHFINLRNLANSRDNLRQAVADLFVLRASLGSALVQVDGEGPLLDANNVTYVGHSLGAIVGTTMLSYENTIPAATLAMPGGGIAQLLANSTQIGKQIDEGLEEAGIETDSAEYNSFLVATQTLVDSGDPINHASTLAQSASTQLHMIEVIGDEVVPNAVPTAPLSGTEPLARQLGLQQITQNSVTGGLVKFSAGDHGSIINPEASEDATVEMQRQTATFAATQGTELPISDTTVIAPVAE